MRVVSVSFVAASLAGLALAGCGPELGACDEQAAHQRVESADGRTFYAGQALMHASCGNGAFCHSAAATGGDRYGVPAGLNFDLNTPTSPTSPAAVHFRRGEVNTRDWREEMWAWIEDGTMPPGDVGQDVVVDTSGYAFTAAGTAGAGGMATGSLPALDTAEGKEIARNWLACNAPVPTEDQWVPGNTSATWDSIYTSIIGPSCAASCHSRALAAGSGGGLMLQAPMEGGDDACAAYQVLVGQTAIGDLCAGQGTLVAPSAPDGSLLVHKLEGTQPCGTPMPPGPGLATTDPQAVQTIREWITAGAQAPECQ